MSLRTLLTATTLASAAIACSSSSGGATEGGTDAAPEAATRADSGSAAADTGTPADTSAPVMYDDAGCVALVNEAPLVQQVNASGEPPTPTGGTITDGTYFLTAAAVYGADAAVGPTGASYQDMTVLSGGGTTYALVSGVGNDAQFSNGTVATIGTGIAITQTCPSNMVYPYPRYSVAGTTITLFSSGATTTVLTYSKQ